MGDDGVAIAAAEVLFQELTEQGIEVIIGETDIDYCLSCIEERDWLLLLDASISGREAGSVWQLPLQHALDSCEICRYQHDADLLSMIKIKGLQLSGLLICIEAVSVEQRFGLSEELQCKLPSICQEIKKIICEYRGEIQYA